MKKFTTYILSFFIILIGLVITTEFIFRDFQNNINTQFIEFNKQECYDIVYLGNSHIGAIGIPNSNSFNFSIGGQDLFHILAIIKTITKKQIDSMIVGVDYDLLGYDYKTANQKWLDRSYYKNTGILYDSTFMNKILAKSKFFLANRNFKYAKLFSRETEKNRNVTSDNFTVKTDCKKRAEEHSVLKYDTTLIKKNLNYLQQIINISKEHKINLTIINTPKTNCYYNFYSKIAKQNGVFHLNKLIEKNKNIQFYDFWGNKKFNDNDFIDNDHLNKVGANKLLKIIYSLHKKQNKAQKP